MYVFSSTALHTNYALAYGERWGRIDHEADGEIVMDAGGSCSCKMHPNTKKNKKKLIKFHFQSQHRATCTDEIFLLFTKQTSVLCQCAFPVVFLDVKIKSLHKVLSEGFKNF